MKYPPRPCYERFKIEKGFDGQPTIVEQEQADQEQERCPRCKMGNLGGCYCDRCGARYADPPFTDQEQER